MLRFRAESLVWVRVQIFCRGLPSTEQAQSQGSMSGIRTGIRARSILGGIGINRMEDGRFVSTLDVEYPLLPLPAVE